MKLSVNFYPFTLIVGVLSVAILSGSSSEFTTATTTSSTTVTSREQQQQQQEAAKSLRRMKSDKSTKSSKKSKGASGGNYSSKREEEEEEITTLQGKKIFTSYLDLAPPISAGMNFIVALSGSAVGPRLNATFVPPSADWLLLKPDGIIAIDAKLLLKTHDGEYIHQTVTGRSVRDPKNPSSSTIRALALFETSSDKYKWLGHTALFGIGTKEGNKLTVDYYDTLL